MITASHNPIRFELEERPYDEDTTELVCTDLRTGEQWTGRPFGEWRKSLRKWMAEQVDKSKERAA